MASNKKNKWTIETFIKKLIKSSDAVVYGCSLLIIYSENTRRFLQIVSALEACSVTKYRSHHADSLF